MVLERLAALTDSYLAALETGLADFRRKAGCWRGIERLAARTPCAIIQGRSRRAGRNSGESSRRYIGGFWNDLPEALRTGGPQNEVKHGQKGRFEQLGDATGLLSIEIAKKYPHLRCISFDLPAAEPIAKRHIAAAGVSARIGTAGFRRFEIMHLAGPSSAAIACK